MPAFGVSLQEEKKKKNSIAIKFFVAKNLYCNENFWKFFVLLGLFLSYMQFL